MRKKRIGRCVLMVAALMAVAWGSVALAREGWNPEQRGARGRQEWGRKAPAEPGAFRRGPQMRPAWAGEGAAAAPTPAQEVNIKVERETDGVTILFTSEKPEVAQRIKQVLPQRIKAMRQMAMHMQQRRATDMPEGMPAHMPFLARKDVQVHTKPLDDGVALTVTSDDPEVAAQIRRLMPRQAQMMRGMLQFARAAGGDALMRLAMSGKVNTEVEPRPGGAALVMTSDDPRLANAIMHALTQKAQSIKKLSTLRREREGRPGMEPPVRPELAPKERPGLERPFARERKRLRRPGMERPASPERGLDRERAEIRRQKEALEREREALRKEREAIREIVREEIQRYLQEKGMEKPHHR